MTTDSIAAPQGATSSSVERAFSLLELIAAAGSDGVTLAQLSAEVSTAKSTTHRYVTTLIRLGAVRRDAAGRLRLGLKLVELAGGVLESDDLRSAAEPILRELSGTTGETVHLGLPSGGDVVYVAKVESPQSVRLVSRIGARVPKYSSAMGKALLAALDDAELERVLADPREARTANTLTSSDALRREVEKIRSQGFAIDNEENELGVRCLGAAIVGARAEPLGAISVSAPASRMSLERCHELAPTIIDAAHEIARRRGSAQAPATP